MASINAEAQRRKEQRSLTCVHLCPSVIERSSSPHSLRLCVSALNSCSRSGFALIEMIAALAVVTGGVFVMVQMLQNQVTASRAFVETQAVTTALQNEVEVLRTMPFAQLSDRRDAPFTRAPEGLDRLAAVQPALTIGPAPDGTPGLKEVRVRIAWKGDKGRRMTKTLTTLIADKGGA